MKTNYLLLLLSLILSMVHSIGWSQCEINVSVNPTEITCGQSADLTAFGSSTGQVILDEDFNTGGFGSGWGSTPGATSFSNPCSPGGVDGTPHAWMDNNTSVPRTLTSAPYNLTAATAGVTICFDLLFAEQGDAAPCEGPDEPDEGVFLQYSTDGGATWVDIYYFDPNGGNDPQLTNWNNWCFQLPVGAITANTLIRWHQIADSGADYDHWGIDNVQIFQNDINAEVVWLHDGYSYGVGNPGGVNPTPVSPTSTTTYTAQITTGTGQVCTADITVVVIDPVYDVTVSANPTNICAGECSTISGTGQQVIDPGGIETYENNEFELVASGSASVNINVQGINTSSIYNGLIQNVTINGFSFSGSFLCTNFGGCNCNGATISFGQTCNLTTSGFTVTLTSPGGCEIILAPAGAATGNYNNTVFVPVGGTGIGGTFPTGGPWDPNEPFSNLNGCDPNGVWTLEFSAPGLGFGIGTLQGWSITFDDPPIYGPVDYSWSPTTGLSNPNDINTEACPVVSTDYELTVSNGTPGCATYTETVSIIVDPCGCVPPNVIIDPLQTCAPGTLNLSNAINPASDPATLSYHATQADAQNDVSPIATTVGTSGSYWVRVEDPLDPDCFTVLEIVATISPVDNASFSLTNFCAGTPNGATGVATPGGTFAFNPAPSDGATINPATGEVTNGVSGTTYTVEYTTNGACPASQTQTVTVSSMSYNASVVDETCGAANGEISLTPNGGSAPYTYSINGGTGQAGGTFTGLTAGNYSIEIIDNNGCIVTGNELVSNIGGPTIQSITPTNPSCPGACDGSITAVVTGGNLPYTYQWFDAGGNPIGTNAATLSNVCAGNYSLEVSDAGGGTTQLFYEDFNSGAAGWNLNVPVGVEGTDPNYFEVDDDEGGVAPGGCGIAGNGDPTLHITSEFFANGGAAYDAGGLCGILFCPESHRRAESPLINTVGQSGLTLNFDYIANGDIPNDQATVWYNAGLGWTQLGAALFSGTGVCTPQGIWTAYSSALPAVCENIPNLQIAIRWDNNDDGVGTDPSVAINNMEIVTSSASSCSVTGTTSLADPAAIDASFDFNDFCAGSANGPVNVATPGGVFAFNPVPTDGATINGSTGVISNGVNGATYTVSYTVGGACAVTETETVTVTGIDFSSTTVGENCGAADGEITLTPTSGTAPYTFSLDAGAGQATGTFTGLTAGSYDAEVTDAYGCSAGSTVIVSAIGGPSIDDLIVVDPSCNGVCDGSLTVQVSGGVPPYSFQWFDAGGNPIGTNSNVLDNVCAGDYSVEVTDANGGSNPVILNTNSDFETGPGGGCSCATGFTCGNDAGQVFDGVHPVYAVGNMGCVSGATNYTNPLGANSGSGYVYFYAGLDQVSTNAITFVGGEQVELCVFYAGPQGAGASGQNTANSHFSFGIDGVQVGPDVQVPVNTPWTEFCFTVTMTAGSHTFNILSGGAAQYSIWFDDFEVTEAGSGGGGTGCPVTVDETLVEPAAVDASFTLTDYCQGSVNAPSGIATSGGSFAFNPVPTDGATIDPATGVIANGVGGSSYTVEYTVGGACAESSTENVTVHALPNPTIAGDLSYCAGGSTTLDAGAGYTAYQWSTSDITQTITTTAQTSITVTVTDANGCVGTSAPVDVVEADVTIQLDASQDPGCNQPDGSISVSATGGDGNYTYSIDGGAFSPNNQFDNLAAGMYQITVVDGSGICTDVIDVTLNQVNGPTITAVNATGIDCFGNANGTIELIANGSGVLTYGATDGVDVYTNATGQFTNLAAGNYTVSVTDPNGCTVTDNVVIDEPTAVELFSFTVNETCADACDGQITWSGQGGTQPYVYTIEGTTSDGSETGLCAGDFTIEVSDANGCTVSTIAQVVGGELVSIDDVLIFDDGCTDECTGSIAVQSANAVVYALDAVSNASGQFTDLCSGTYLLTVESTNGCQSQQIVNVGGSDPVEAYFNFDPRDPTMFESTVNFDDQSYNADSYSWVITGNNNYLYTTNDEDFTHIFPADTGHYEVCLIASNAEGCLDTMCETIVVVDEFVIYVPNTFTPDGDEFNQNLLAHVYGIDLFDFHMQIFDRWGEMIFESFDASIGWDGTYKGKLVQSGTYTWKITAKDVQKDFRKTIVGHVNVLR